MLILLQKNDYYINDNIYLNKYFSIFYKITMKFHYNILKFYLSLLTPIESMALSISLFVGSSIKKCIKLYKLKMA